MRRAAAPLSALVVLCLAVAVAAQEEKGGEWNAAEITSLADELCAALDDGLAAAAKAPPQQTVLQQRTRDAALKEMKHARSIAGDYAEKMRGGWTREESEIFFLRVRATIDGARKTARDAIPEPRVAELLDRVDQILRRIADRYAKE